MAGGAGDFAQIPSAAVNGGDDTQRHVDAVQHRALFDMYLNETHIAGRIALQRRDVFGIQASVLHGLSHADAIFVGLI
jgi:hypothetical protein